MTPAGTMDIACYSVTTLVSIVQLFKDDGGIRVMFGADGSMAIHSMLCENTVFIECCLWPTRGLDTTIRCPPEREYPIDDGSSATPLVSSATHCFSNKS